MRAYDVPFQERLLEEDQERTREALPEGSLQVGKHRRWGAAFREGLCSRESVVAVKTKFWSENTVEAISCGLFADDQDLCELECAVADLSSL